MNVEIRIVADPAHRIMYTDAAVMFNDILLRVSHGAEVTTFPLSAIVSFTTSETETP